MATKKRVGLVLSPTYFMYVDRVSEIAGPLVSYDSMYRQLEDGVSWRPDDPYQCRYVIGDAFNRGIIREYCRHGWEVDVIEQSNLMDSIESGLGYAVLDFQFATEIPMSVIEQALAEGYFVVGWWPTLLANKCFQALFVRNALPDIIFRQAAMWSLGAVASITNEAIDGFIEPEHLIVKSFYTALSKMPDGTDYLVLGKRKWREFARLCVYRPTWFIGGQGIVVSGLMQSGEDDYPGWNNIVHKIHLATGLSEDMRSAWSLDCHKLLNSLKLDAVGEDIVEFGTLYGSGGWIRGNLEFYRPIIDQLARSLCPFPSLFGADFICNPDGRLVLLELNRFAGTFLDPLGIGGKSTLQAYVDAVTSIDLDTHVQRERYELFRKRFGETIRQIEPVTWI